MLKKITKYLSSLKLEYSKDFILFAIGFFITSIIALAISVFVNKSLDQENLGKLTYYKSLLELLSYACTLLLYRSYLRFNVSGINEYLFKVVKIASIFAIIVIAISAFVLTGSIFSVLFAFFVLYEERLYFFRSLLATSKLNVLRIGAALITLVSVLVITFFYELRSDLVLFSYGIGFLISLFLIKSPKKIIVAEKPKTDHEVDLKTILLFSFPALAATLIKVSQDFFSQFLIKEYFDFTEVSKFSIALRVLLSVKMFSSLLMMYYPSVYFREIQRKNKVTIKKIRLYMSLSMTIVSIFAIIFAKQLYILMGAGEYLEYILFFKILVLAELINVIGGFYGTYLSYAIKTHLSMIFYFAATVVNIIILVSLLKSNGIITAAIGILISNIILLAFHLLVSRRMEVKFLKTNE